MQEKLRYSKANQTWSVFFCILVDIPSSSESRGLKKKSSERKKTFEITDFCNAAYIFSANILVQLKGCFITAKYMALHIHKDVRRKKKVSV